jgi:hypothetical protein
MLLDRGFDGNKLVKAIASLRRAFFGPGQVQQSPTAVPPDRLAASRVIGHHIYNY